MLCNNCQSGCSDFICSISICRYPVAANENDLYLSLLHELGHALIDKTDYNQDVELLQIESAAWTKAKELCAKYHLAFDESYAESRLDSYRDLLHYNSLCPNCGLNGYEDEHQTYHCPLCGASWQGKYQAK